MRGGRRLTDGALAPLARRLPSPGPTPHVHDLERARIAYAVGVDRSSLTAAALSDCAAASPTISRSAAGSLRAVVASGGGRVGIDVETIERVAANGRRDDYWLSPEEQEAVTRANCPTIEIACRWVLKEAYGKALGVGLALPLAGLTFRPEASAIVLRRAAAPPIAEGWTFALFQAGGALFGVATQADPQAIPFAPLGRNPPVIPLDRYSILNT